MSDSIEKKIARYEEQYKIIEKSIVDVIWVVDIEKMRFTHISPSVETISGYTAEEIQHLPIKEQLSARGYKKAMEYLAEGHRKFKLETGCKKIRDENGTWWHVEEYVAMHSEADFSHTICPPCRKRIYPESG
jgi:PAS domain S-box-containing protein